MAKGLLLQIAAYFAILILNSCSGCTGNSSTDRFSYELIPVQSEEKWGYIDLKGKYVVNPQFKHAYLFCDGLAVVGTSDEKFGFIGEDGKYIINPTYKFATNFSEGLAFVASENGFPTCINKKGETQFELKQAAIVGVFQEGLAFIQVKDKYGFIDKSGKIVINPQFEQVKDFSEGLAAVSVQKDKDSKNVWGYIDKSGKIIVNPQFEFAGNFKEGKAVVANDKKYGFIDTKGLYVINPQFDGAAGFSEGLAGVLQGESWGFINQEGKIVINPQFESISTFKNGLASVRSGKENWGYIDKEGKFAINPQFTAAGDFFGDYAPVGSGDKVGLIDKKGKYVVNPQFSDVASYLSVISTFVGWNFYESISSDYFDIAEVAEKLFENSKDGTFRGLNKLTSVKNLLENPDYKESLKENSEYSAISFEEKDLTDEVSIEKTTFFTQTAIYSYVPQYYYDYQVGSDKKYNLSALLEGVEYKLVLNKWGKAKNKGKILAEGIKAELQKRYDIKDINSNTANAPSAYADTTVTVEDSDNEGETIHANGSQISFTIGYTDNAVTLRAIFKGQPNM